MTRENIYHDFSNGCEKPFYIEPDEFHDDWHAIGYKLGCGKYQEYHKREGVYCDICYEASRARKEHREREACRCIIQEGWLNEETVWFVTLTHADQWKVEDGKRVKYTLSDEQILKHFQDMIKVLRKTNSFEYRLYPEYGAENGRFHLHILVWNFAGGSSDFYRWKEEWRKRIPNTTEFDFQKIVSERKMHEYLTKYITKQNVKGRIRCSKKPWGISLKELKEEWRKRWLEIDDPEGVNEWSEIVLGFQVRSPRGCPPQVDPCVLEKRRVELKQKSLSIHKPNHVRIHSAIPTVRGGKQCEVNEDFQKSGFYEETCWFPTQKIPLSRQFQEGELSCWGLMHSVQAKRYKVLEAMLSLPQLRLTLLHRQGQFMSLAYFWLLWRHSPSLSSRYG